MPLVLNEIRKYVRLRTLVGAFLAIYIAFYLVQTVIQNYQMQKEITILQEQLTDIKIEQDQLRYKIQYYQTEAFKEKEARSKLGLQAPGETVVILPQEDKPAEEDPEQKQVKKKSNPQQWADFLLGRR